VHTPDLSPLLRVLYRGPRGPAPAVVNPYRDEHPGLDQPGGARRRRRNLEAYLERVGTPRRLLLGEALGFRGGRFSGIAFTSERQLAGDDGRRLPWAGAPFAATSRNPALWLEPSGSVVWGALGGEPRGVLLWNAFPWHPYGKAGPLSNRAPERALLAANLHVLERLLAALGDVPVLAVGRTAAAALAALGVAAPTLRHPAHGGAALFREQLRKALSVLHLSD
jgi:uracil DNA glycosylase superfamily protein